MSARLISQSPGTLHSSAGSPPGLVVQALTYVKNADVRTTGVEATASHTKRAPIFAGPTR